MSYIKTTFAIAALAAGALTANAQAFQKGDIVVDLNLGVGTLHTTESFYNSKGDVERQRVNKATFTERLGVEFGVYDINDKMSIGVGFDFVNSSSAAVRQFSAGSYNYDVKYYEYTLNAENQWVAEQKQTQRSGAGVALADVSVNDFAAIARGAFHYSPLDRLDLYAALGFGVSYTKISHSNLLDVNGFESDVQGFDVNGPSPQYSYAYDDLRHVQWAGGSSQGRIAASFTVGARYYLTDNIALNGEFGLPCVTFKAHNNNYSIFSLGASYSF